MSSFDLMLAGGEGELKAALKLTVDTETREGKGREAADGMGQGTSYVGSARPAINMMPLFRGC